MAGRSTASSRVNGRASSSDCMARQVEVDPRVYARLGDDADRPQVQALRSQACIQLRCGGYVTPDEVSGMT